MFLVVPDLNGISAAEIQVLSSIIPANGNSYTKITR